MAKSKNTGAAPVKKQTTEPKTPAPVADPAAVTTPAAPTTNPANDPTVVPPVTDKNVADPNVDDSEITKTDDHVDDEPEQPEQVEVKESMKRAELDAIATEAGLTNASKYKDKAAVVAAVERVRAGEAASDVDTDVTPVVSPAGADNEVEAISPFFDLTAKTARVAGDKFKVTETRAAELRGHKLIK